MRTISFSLVNMESMDQPCKFTPKATIYLNISPARLLPPKKDFAMAIPTPKTAFPFTSSKKFNTSLSYEKQFLTPFPTKNNHSIQLLTTTNVLSRANEQLSLSFADLDLENNTEMRNKVVIERKESEKPSLAESWKEILGDSDWAGMLDPMDPLLRSELIRYGEMAQSCYDAFDFEPFSKYCGSCRFPRGEFFERLGMKSCGYEITRYLYATSNINLPNFFKKSRWPKVWSRNANWIGHVAVSNDEMSRKLGRRDITISWRGTVTRLEWIADMMDFLRPIRTDKIPSPDPTVKIQSGFLDLYTDKDEACTFCKYSAREQILAELNRLLIKYSNEEVSITITGHSLGSALATLNGYDIVETGINVLSDGRAVPVCVFSFSGPRVGNVRFKERAELLGLKVLRVVNVHDIVPKAPGFFFNENASPMVMKMAEKLPWSYSHVGVELSLNHENSPFLKPDADKVCAHNLEAHLHLIDGYHGRGERFALAIGRDPALVNKASDFLKDHYMVPPNWRQDENKGMLRAKDGRYIQPERPKIDDHPNDTYHHLIQLGLASNPPSAGEDNGHNTCYNNVS